MRNFLYLLGFLAFTSSAFAQEKNIAGIVFDRETKFRLSRVRIINTQTKQTVFNNAKGEFYINAKPGDVLICNLMGYQTDSLKITNQETLIIYLKRLSIRLQEVVVKDSVLSAKAKYEEVKRDFNKLYRIGNNKDLITVGQGGAGLGIDAIWSAFSKEGRNARRLLELMERDYQNAFVDQVFTRDLVSRNTGLTGDKLLIFMLNNRPGYIFASKASAYDLLNYIRLSYMRFNINANYQDVSGLKPIE